MMETMMETKKLRKMTSEEIYQYCSGKTEDWIAQIRDDDPDAHRQLVDDIQGKIDWLSQSLYPERDDFDTLTSRPSTHTQADTAWHVLDVSTFHAASALFEMLMQQDRRDWKKRGAAKGPQQEKVNKLATTCRRLLRQRLEIQMYQLRLASNYDYLELSHMKDEMERNERLKIRRLREVIKEYRQTLHEWDDKLMKHLPLPRHPLKFWFEDADHMMLLSNSFGPGDGLALKEPGWAVIARRARARLYYEAQETRRLSLLEKDGGRLRARLWARLEALWLWVQKFLTGYNTQNLRLFIPPVFIWLIFGFVYWVIDWSSGCAAGQTSQQSVWGSIQQFLGNILYSANVLIGSGQAAQTPCNPNYPVFAVVEGVFGYASLAILAALLFEILNKRKF